MHLKDLDSKQSLEDEREVQDIVRSIIASRALDGATASEIKADYYGHIGEEFPFQDNILQFLMNIPHIVCKCTSEGTWLFNLSSSEKSQHILDMVKKQKQSKRYTDSSDYRAFLESDDPFVLQTPEDLCYFKDNYRYYYSSQATNSSSTSRNTYNTRYTTDHSGLSNTMKRSQAFFYDFQMLGDDFFLCLAKMELNCRFSQRHKILQSGFCVSGQTIRDAIDRIRSASYIHPNMILNIGSVDILHGHCLFDLQTDFQALISLLKSRGVTPIITTLAPLANYAHLCRIRNTLNRFNDFLRSNWQTIDLWKCMVKQNGRILYDCYQLEPRYVSGSSQPHMFWNKIGRQRVLRCIKDTLPAVFTPGFREYF